MSGEYQQCTNTVKGKGVGYSQVSNSPSALLEDFFYTSKVGVDHWAAVVSSLPPNPKVLDSNPGQTRKNGID